MPFHLRAFLLLAFLAAPMLLRADVIEVRLSPKLSHREAGRGLRAALNAYEDASREPLPQAWKSFDLRRGQSVKASPNIHVALLEGDATSVRVLVADDLESAEGVLQRGEEQTVGALQFLLLSGIQGDGTAQTLIRAAKRVPLLAEPEKRSGTAIRIRPLNDPAALEIESSDDRVLEFSRLFLVAMNEGKSARDAAAQAREAVPPTAPLLSHPGSLSSRGGLEGIPATPSRGVPADEEPFSAFITLTLVRGNADALRQLGSELAYDSRGRSTDRPRVGARSGGDGGTVSIGSGADRLNAKLRALEANGELDLREETFVNAPLNGQAGFSFGGPQGGVSGNLYTRRAGADGIILALDQGSGDWSFLGTVSTEVRIREGQTVPLARNEYSRSTEAKSGVPILGDIPILGPIFRNEESTSSVGAYALFATMELN